MLLLIIDVFIESNSPCNPEYCKKNNNFTVSLLKHVMRSWKTKNGFDIIQVLSGRSNVYLIKKNDCVILMDTGKKSSFVSLSKKLNSLNIAIEDITILILTHTHFDHCQSAKEIKQKSMCNVIASAKATNSIIKGYAKLPDGTFFTTKFLAKLGQLVGKRKFGFEPFQQDIFVADEYDLNIADRKSTRLNSSH